jgi:DNA polymerase-3 subunit delta
MGLNQKSIIEGKLEPVYILTGNDSYTKQKLEKELEQKVEKTAGSFSTSIIDGNETPAREIMYELSNSSLFENLKLIIIKNGETPLAEDAFKKFIKSYALREDPPNIVVIEAAKGRAFKGIKQQKIDVPYENQIPGWIKGNISSYGKRITDDAANLLAFYCGRNLHNIAGEIEKLFTAYPDKDVFHIDEIKTIAGDHKKDDVFGYLNALIDGNDKKALTLLQNLLNYGTEPLQLVGLLKWKIQQLITARMLMDRGYSEKAILDEMKLFPQFLYRGLCGKLKRFPLEKLLKIYNGLYETDLALKTNSSDKFLLLEKFTFQFLIC